jgi:hypothetical protein
LNCTICVIKINVMITFAWKQKKIQLIIEDNRGSGLNTGPNLSLNEKSLKENVG